MCPAHRLSCWLRLLFEVTSQRFLFKKKKRNGFTHWQSCKHSFNRQSVAFFLIKIPRLFYTTYAKAHSTTMKLNVALVAMASLVGLASAIYDPSKKDNVVVYWVRRSYAPRSSASSVPHHNAFFSQSQHSKDPGNLLFRLLTSLFNSTTHINTLLRAGSPIT